MASKPVPQLQDQMNLAVDALCQLLFGAQPSQPCRTHQMHTMA